MSPIRTNWRAIWHNIMFIPRHYVILTEWRGEVYQSQIGVLFCTVTLASTAPFRSGYMIIILIIAIIGAYDVRFIII